MVTEEEAVSTSRRASCYVPPGRLPGTGAAQRGEGVDAALGRARGGVGAAMDAAGGDEAAAERTTQSRTLLNMSASGANAKVLPIPPAGPSVTGTCCLPATLALLW